jgi:transcriptional regulator with XRE-family HTH domain
MSVGHTLKAAREAKKVSLETISKRTKIPVKYLEALEKDDFSVFPSQTYSKSFIRAYAKVVGLDPSVMTRQFNAEVQPVEVRIEPMNIEAEMEKGSGWRPASAPPPAAPVRAARPEEIEEEYADPFLREPGSSRKQRSARQGVWARRFSQAFGYVVILGLAGTTVYFGQGILNRIKWDHAVPRIGPETLSAYVPVEVQDKYQHLILKGIDKAWVQVITDDGKTTSEVDLEEGEVKTYQAVKNFRLKIGNAGGVDIHFNGRSLGVLGVSGQVTEIVLPEGSDADNPNS